MRPSPHVPRLLILTVRMSAAAALLAALVGLAPLTSRGDMGKITVIADSKGTATAGDHPKKKGEKSSPAAVKSQQTHISAYDGETKFDAEYDITLDKDGKLEKGTVQFKTVYFTNGGKEEATDFTTVAIKVTDVTVEKGTNKLLSFKFEGKEWYDPNSPHIGSVTSNGIKGEINLATKMSSYTAVYIFKPNGTINTYVVTSKAAPGPGPDPSTLTHAKPDEDIFSPGPAEVPEPTSLVLMATGAVGLLGCRLRKRRRVTGP